MTNRGRKPGERAAALQRGDGVYTGAPCKRCKGTERYTSNGGCIECQNKKPLGEIKDRLSAWENRQDAIVLGRTHYNTTEPCSKCGGTLRYTSNASCVTCTKSRTIKVREIRAALYHSDTSPIVWIEEPPSPETAPLYAMCPTLAAYAGRWTAVYSDAQHLSPAARIFPGCDVLKRPAALQMMLNDKTHPGHAIALHLAPAYYAALRAYNDKLTGR
nr:MAG: hypothetical protein [Bacteriophage sp.]